MKVSDWNNGIKQLRAAFPKLEDTWIELLTAKMKEKQFTQAQFRDAIDNVITNCKYPTPQLADILNYNKGIRIFNHQEFLDETKEAGSDYRKYYQAIDIDGKLFYAHKTQLRDYNVDYKEWVNKPLKDATKYYKKPESEPKETKPALSYLADFDKRTKDLCESNLGKELVKANYDAQMAWGNDANKYNEAMQRVEKLRLKIGVWN